MSKKTKTVTLDDFGEVTLSPLTVGWLEENTESVVENLGTTAQKSNRGAVEIIAASLHKRHPDITVDQLRESLLVSEATDLVDQILELSGLKPGGADPESQQQASSSEN